MAEFPGDWDEKNLGDLLAFKNGYNADSSRYGKGIPFASVLDALQLSPMTEQTIHGRVLADSSAINSFGLKKGDLVFMRSSETLEEVGWCNVYQGADNQALFGGFVIRGRPICEFDSVFLNYLLRFPENRERVFREGAGAIHFNIGQSGLARVRIALPKSDEQRRIADALASIDKLIDNLARRIEKKRLVKQGVMQELLTGKKRLPGCKGKWRNITIGELGELTGSGVDKKFVNGETPVRLVNYVDVFHRDFLWNRDLHFWTTADSKKHNLCNVLKGDVFFTPSSEMPHDIALSAVAMEDMENVCYSYHVYRLRFSQDIALAFRSYMFKTEAFYQQANRACDGSGTRYVITLPKFRRMSVSIPNDYAEQQAIAQVLGNMDAEIAKLETKRDKYVDIKQGMMNDLLTGKVRI